MVWPGVRLALQHQSALSSPAHDTAGLLDTPQCDNLMTSALPGQRSVPAICVVVMRAGVVRRERQSQSLSEREELWE